MNAVRWALFSVVFAVISSVAPAQVKVAVSDDVVYMRDGTQVTGTVLVQGARAVIILTDKGEEVVSTEQVERIVRRPGGAGPKNFATTVKDGFHQVLPVQVQPAEGSTTGTGVPGVNLRVGVEKPPIAGAPAPAGAGRTADATTLARPPTADRAALEEWLKKALEEAKQKDLLKEFKAAQ